MCFNQLSDEGISNHIQAPSTRFQEAKEALRKAFDAASRAVSIAKFEARRPKTHEEMMEDENGF